MRWILLQCDEANLYSWFLCSATLQRLQWPGNSDLDPHDLKTEYTQTKNSNIGDCLNGLYHVSRYLKSRDRRRRILITWCIYLKLLKIHNNIWNITNMNMSYNKYMISSFHILLPFTFGKVFILHVRHSRVAISFPFARYWKEFRNWKPSVQGSGNVYCLTTNFLTYNWLNVNSNLLYYNVLI